MTPEEKSKSLVLKYETFFINANADSWSKEAKQSALICANEMIYELSDLPRIPYNERREKFWKEVKEEIEKL